jgi:hypothetical protein
MIYIPILIIIIILSIDLYFSFSIRFGKKKNNETFENEEDEIIFDEPNPWNKVQYFAHINKYYIKINKLNDHIEKIMLWKSLPIIKNDLIDVDIENNYLILKTHNEEEALVICNLILNHINNNLTINDIVSKNLINYSINKAKRYKLIGTKLTELIKAGLLELDYNKDNIESYNDKEKVIDKIKLKDEPKEKFNNNNVKELFDRITAYEGSEYASINF